MRVYDVIEHKKNGRSLTNEMIDFFVRGVTDNSIPDYQISALLMAICINGMDRNEIFYFTEAMASSGRRNDLSAISHNVVDKHSSGGVGDKCTLIIGPIVSSLGIPFAKLSGKGLGHTGGTIDKLDSVKGLRTSLKYDEFVSQVQDIGIAISSQTGDLAPADKKLYAIRDVTATIDSIPLIAASIMSKKIASGAANILLDVKCGSGAFMKVPDKAFELAETMMDIGHMAGRNMTALVTDMDQPLGRNIGNSLEVIEACEVLNGKGPDDITELCVALSAGLLKLSGYRPKVSYADDARESINNGRAYNKFRDFIYAQGGAFEGSSLYPIFRNSSKYLFDIKAEESGYIFAIDSQSVGISALELGAGRKTQDDDPDHSVGIVMHRKTGERVTIGDRFMTLHYNLADIPEEAVRIARSSVKISVEKPVLKPMILKVFESDMT